MTAAVVVSEEVDDLILGIDWLGPHRCRWSFAQNLIEIDGKVVRLISHPCQNMLRRIYAIENIVVPAGHTTNVPMTMAFTSLHQTSGEVEPRSLGTGILAARTLMRDEGRRSAVQVMNVGEKDFVLRRGEFIGEAGDDEGSEGEGVFLEEAVVPTGSLVEESDLEENCDDAHVQVVINTLPPELKLDQETAAEKFIRDRAGMFLKSDYNIGRTNLVQHEIDTGMHLHRPFRQPLRRHHWLTLRLSIIILRCCKMT